MTGVGECDAEVAFPVAGKLGVATTGAGLAAAGAGGT